MGVYWLEAEEAVAEAIAQSDSRGVYDWPSLSMRGFEEEVLVALWAILRDAPGNDEAVTGAPLASDAAKGTSVARVNVEFVQRLAALEGPDIDRTAAEWLKRRGLAGWARETAKEVLRELVSVAQIALDNCTPVLQVTDEL